MLDKLAESLWAGPGAFRIYTVILVVAVLGWFYWKHEISNTPNLYVKELRSYLVEEGIDSFRLGVTLDLVNKDTNKVWIVSGVRQRGSFTFDVTSASIILQTIGILRGDGEVIGAYHLSAGGRTIVKVKAQQLIQMHIVGGDPKLLLDMNWELILDNKALKVIPEKLVFNGVISSAKWENLNIIRESNLVEAKPEYPRFREKDKEVFTLVVGQQRFPKKKADLRVMPAYPIELMGRIPFKMYSENGVIFVDAEVYGGEGNPSIIVSRNEFSVSRQDWDKNYSNDALEVVAGNQVVFQMIIRDSDTVEINGVFSLPDGSLMVANPVEENALTFLPRGHEIAPIKPIFKYPSWKYKGQYVVEYKGVSS